MGEVKDEAVGLGVEDKVEEASKAEVAASSTRTEVKTTAEAAEVVEVKGPPEAQDTHVIGLRDMLICLLLSPVSGTGPSESLHIFVWSQGHARGRTSGSPKPTNETLTNSTIRKISR